MPVISLLSTTISSAEAGKQLAVKLVESRLAACVQMDGPIESVYRWQGQLCVDTEFRLTCKTLPTCIDRAILFVKQNHSYETPEILIEQAEVSADYFQWLTQQVVEPEVVEPESP
jgi:periplasmic divalent cation tolerance protein